MLIYPATGFYTINAPIIKFTLRQFLFILINLHYIYSCFDNGHDSVFFIHRQIIVGIY